MDTSDVKDVAHDAAESRPVEWVARLGFAVSGLLHLLIAWIALEVAWSSSGGSPSQSGALTLLAGSLGGEFLLWVVVTGCALLAVWELTQAIRNDPVSGRLKAAHQLRRLYRPGVDGGQVRRWFAGLEQWQGSGLHGGRDA